MTADEVRSAEHPPRDGAEVDADADAARSGQDDDFDGGLASLSRLATGRLDLKETLLRVAQCASKAIPGANGVGLTLIEDGRPDTIVATESFVAEMDAVQYDLGQGPCLSAVASEESIISGEIASDPRWPDFGAQSQGFGVQSSLSIPLVTSEGIIGSLNVYAYGLDVFDDRAASLGGYFGVPAAVAVQNAQILSESKRLAVHLRRALNNRMTVERAIGVLMTRSGCGPEEAMAKIRTISHTEHKKIDVVAQNIVDSAVRRGRARHSG